MDTANAVRGEVDLELDGTRFVLRPSYEAIVAMEQQTGRSLVHLAEATGSSAIGHEDAAIVVAECIKAWGKATGDADAAAVNAKRIGKLLVDAGILTILKRLELMLFMAATGGYTASGEVKATGKTIAATPAAE